MATPYSAGVFGYGSRSSGDDVGYINTQVGGNKDAALRLGLFRTVRADADFFLVMGPLF